MVWSAPSSFEIPALRVPRYRLCHGKASLLANLSYLHLAPILTPQLSSMEQNKKHQSCEWNKRWLSDNLFALFEGFLRRLFPGWFTSLTWSSRSSLHLVRCPAVIASLLLLSNDETWYGSHCSTTICLHVQGNPPTWFVLGRSDFHSQAASGLWDLAYAAVGQSGGHAWPMAGWTDRWYHWMVWWPQGQVVGRGVVGPKDS